MRMLMIIVTLLVFASSALAECTTNARGRTVCSNGEDAAGGVNTRTGTVWKSQQNQAGVTTTETSRGGEAKTRNGKGVYRSPSGKTCVKTANNQGCN